MRGRILDVLAQENDNNNDGSSKSVGFGVGLESFSYQNV